MNRESAARALSIGAHPALLMPVAVIGSAVHRDATPRVLEVAAGASVVVAAAVFAYSHSRVRAGRWSHADASRPPERVQLNLFLVVALLMVAALSLLFSQPRAVTVGALSCAAVAVAALLLRQWLKLSLHLAFAALAAVLWWPVHEATVLLLLIAVGLAWSRLTLGRHTRAEVALGAVVGGAAGVAFQLLAFTSG